MDKKRKYYGIRRVSAILITCCVFTMFLINILQIFGCVDFTSGKMRNVFFASIMFLCLLFIYECNYFKDEKKNFLIGILSGTILFVYEKFFFLLLVFLINIIWSKVSMVYSRSNCLKDVGRIVIYTMFVVELYSVCAWDNNDLYVSFWETTILSKVIDIVFVLSIVVYVVCGQFINQLLCEDKNENNIKKKRYAEITRLFIWSILVCIVVAIVIIELCVESSVSVDNMLFYLGKTIDGGYLFYGDEVSELVYYANKVENSVGGVVQNATAYQYFLLEDGFVVQKWLLYMLKYVYQFFYSIYGVIFGAIVVIGILINKIIYIGLKRNKVQKGL